MVMVTAKGVERIQEHHNGEVYGTPKCGPPNVCVCAYVRVYRPYIHTHKNTPKLNSGLK